MRKLGNFLMRWSWHYPDTAISIVFLAEPTATTAGAGGAASSDAGSVRLVERQKLVMVHKLRVVQLIQC
jgi:hypothetical protein